MRKKEKTRENGRKKEIEKHKLNFLKKVVDKLEIIYYNSKC